MANTTAFHSSFSQRLRAIGQALEAKQVEDFDLEVANGGFVVRGKERSYAAWANLPRLLASLWRSQAKSFSDIHYSSDELEKLELAGVAKRENFERTPDFHTLSQMLRTVGLYIDRTDFRFVGLTRRGPRLVFQFQEGEGNSRVEEHLIASFHSYFLRMYFKRNKRTFTPT